MTSTAFRARGACLLAALAAIGTAACGRRRKPEPTVVVAPSASRPADRLAANEVAPGLVTVFGFVFPRGSVVERNFGREVYVRVPLAPEAAASYVQQKLPSIFPVMGPRGTVFSDFRTAELAPDAHLRLHLRVHDQGRGTMMILERWEDPPPVHPEPHDEVMRKAGLTPDGKMLDPTRGE